MQSTTIAVDLAKSVFEVATSQRPGIVSKRSRLIHGARATLCHAKKSREPDRLRAWALDRERACGHNKAAVALANKMARIVWAVWSRKENFAAPCEASSII